jgi:HPt (histidine-containing phosphotransfer) domain-containing protein
MGNLETIDGGPLPIDLEHLSQYTANDPALTRDVLQIYRDQAEGWLAALGDAADLKAWKDAAHTLKGASRGVGANEVALLAEEAELLPALDVADRDDLYARLERALARATRYAGQLLEDSPFVG